jgi:DNA-binding CsgD family transcriptional regulator
LWRPIWEFSSLLRITPAERGALQLLAEGKSTSDIASCLGVNADDVWPSLSALFARMGAATQTEAIAAAARRGLLAPDTATHEAATA